MLIDNKVLGTNSNNSVNMLSFNVNDNRILNGDLGDDTLEGSSREDILDGGLGNDTYIFQKGYGEDIIGNYTIENNRLGVDILRMIEIREEEVKIQFK